MTTQYHAHFSSLELAPHLDLNKTVEQLQTKSSGSSLTNSHCHCTRVLPNVAVLLTAARGKRQEPETLLVIGGCWKEQDEGFKTRQEGKGKESGGRQLGFQEGEEGGRQPR